LEHFPEKWIPVFRRKCDQLKERRKVTACPGAVNEAGCRADPA
jgi:hypothetical protein